MSLREKLLRNIILPLGDQIFGQRMITRLKYLEQAQYWPREVLMAKQKDELQQLIHIAYNEVPFYKQLLDDVKVKPEKVNELKDLSMLPIVTKDMLREDYPQNTTRLTGQKIYQASTSGSTGKNFYVMEDAYTAGWYRASFLLEMGWTGWEIGEPHLQLGMTVNRSLDRRLKDLLMGCHYKSAYKLDDFSLGNILRIVEKYNLQYIWGYPGSLYYLARFADEQGWNRPVKAIASWGDSLYPHYKRIIESVFRSKVFDTYGCAEGFHIAGQCEYGNYHLHVLDTVVEFLDDDGKPVRAGQIGNIIVTRLHPGPMPLIRYWTGDLGIPSGKEYCPCGRNFPLMSSIQGRDTDVIITPSGNRLIVHFFTGILEHFSAIDSFQVVQTTPSEIVLKILPYITITEEQIRQIIKILKEKGTDMLEIKVEIVEEIPLPPSGKHKFVISHIRNYF
jgi:phenylacetate-CoA ligase